MHISRILTAVVLIRSGLFHQGIAQVNFHVMTSDQVAIPAVFITDGNQSGYTDDEGRLQINLSGSKAHFQHLSYAAKSIEIKDGQAYTIVLEELSYGLDPISVSTSYATQNDPITRDDLSEERIERENNGRDMPYILQQSPSVLLSSDAGTGIGYTYMRVRGSDQERINVTINGVPLNDAESQQVFWVDIPELATQAEGVQIQRGLGLNVAGTGAFGASVNVSTRSLSTDPGARLISTIGSFGTRRWVAQIQSGTLGNHWSFSGQVGRNHSDGYIDRARADLTSYYGALRYTRARHAVELYAFGGDEITYQAWNGVGINLIEDPLTRRSNSAGTEKSGTPHDNQVDDYGQRHFQLLHHWQINPQIYSRATLHYTRGQGFFELYQGSETLSEYGIAAASSDPTGDIIERRWLDNDFYGGLYHLEYSPSAHRNIQLGLGYNRYLGDHFGEVIWAENALELIPDQRYYENDAVKDEFNLFSRWSETIGSLTGLIDLQYRRVGYTFDGFDTDGSSLRRSVSHGFINPRLGLNYQLSGDLKMYGFIGYGHREPNRNDYTESTVNSSPRPEKMLNVEAGYRHTLRDFAYSVNAYWMDYRDQLVPTGELNDVGASTRSNVDNSYRLGLELTGNYRAGDRWDIYSGLTLSRNRIRSFSQYIDDYDIDFNYLGQREVVREDVPLVLSPSVQGQIGAYYRPISRLQLGVTGRYVSRQYLDNTGSDIASLDPYGLIDLSLQYPIRIGSTTLELKAQMMNALDHRYETFGWVYPYFNPGTLSGDFTRSSNTDLYRDIGLYPQAGRHVFLTASWSF